MQRLAAAKRVARCVAAQLLKTFTDEAEAGGGAEVHATPTAPAVAPDDSHAAAKASIPIAARSSTPATRARAQELDQ